MTPAGNPASSGSSPTPPTTPASRRLVEVLLRTFAAVREFNAGQVELRERWHARYGAGAHDDAEDPAPVASRPCAALPYRPSTPAR